MRLFWLALAVLIGIGGYHYSSVVQSSPSPGLWEIRVKDPKVTSAGLTDEQEDRFETSLLRDLGIDETPGTRRECMSAATIWGLRQLGSQAVPSGFDAADCTRGDSGGAGGVGGSGQCRKPDGSVAMRYTVGSQTAADRLNIDVNLDYDFVNQGERSKAAMTLRYEGRRVGDCPA